LATSKSSRKPRGIGRGRKIRRTLERGGTGLGHRLNQAVGGWKDVRITPMFGRWGYFVGDTLFGCFPLREKDHNLWLRLSSGDQTRALRDSRVRPHRRFARRGWIELDVTDPADLGLALHWLHRAHAAATRGGGAGTGADQVTPPTA
jgi:hypothetical protein